MKNERKQRKCRTFLTGIAAGIILSAGSGAAATVDTEQQPIFTQLIKARMKANVRETQNIMMPMISDAVGKQIGAFADPMTVQAAQKRIKKKRIMYKSVHPMLVETCATISTPNSSEKTNALVDEKNAESTKANAEAIFFAGK
ncbi:MAG: hypothetical protein D3924_13170 [Candidatus Electrothrix sp. AR4]|nr:hypothetical protein [Candidatus Electrothrix sp. AR4]